MPLKRRLWEGAVGRMNSSQDIGRIVEDGKLIRKGEVSFFAFKIQKVGRGEKKMKRKAQFLQKGMQKILLSLAVTVGVLTLGQTSEVSAANGQINIRQSALDKAHLKMAEGSGKINQYAYNNAEITPIKLTTTSYVTPGSSSLGDGGYYIPEGLFDDVDLAGLTVTYEDNVITISGFPNTFKNVNSLPEAKEQKVRTAEMVANTLTPIGIVSGWKDQLIFDGGNGSEMEYDDGWGYWKNYTTAAGIYNELTGGYRYKATSEYPVSETFVVHFSNNWHNVYKGDCDYGTMKISINGRETSIAEEQNHSSQAKNPHIVQCPLVEVTPQEGYVCTAIKMDDVELDLIDDCKAYIKNMPNHDVYIDAEFRAKDSAAYTVTIVNPDGSNLKLSEESGALVQKGDSQIAIDPIKIETTSYVTPGSDSFGDGGYYITEGSLDSLKSYGLNVAYEGNTVTITGKPNANVEFTLPTAPAQSSEVRKVSEKLCYLGTGTWAGTTSEMSYSHQNGEWVACSDGTTTIGNAYAGSVVIKYASTPQYPLVSEEHRVLVDEMNWQKKVEIQSSEYGQIKMTYNGIETSYMETQSISSFKHKMQQPQVEVTVNPGYTCNSLTLTSDNGVKKAEIALTDGKGILNYEGGGSDFVLAGNFVAIPYAITVTEATNGTVQVLAGETAVTAAGLGTELTIDADPAEDFEIASVSVKTADGKAVEVKDNKFIMPQAAVTVTVEFQMTEAKRNEMAAAMVTELIGKIGEVSYTETSKAALDAARTAFDALTDDQKALISEETKKVLTDAEAAYEELKVQMKETEDKKVSDAALKAIEAIGKVEYTDSNKAAIKAARAAYDALTEDQKALIPAEKLKTLTDAEKQFAALEAAELAPKLEQTKAGKTSVAFTWKEDKNASAGYRIYIKGGKFKKFTKVTDVKKGVTSYTLQKAKNKKLSAGTTYEVKITSLKKSGKKTVTLSSQKLKVVTVTAAPTISSAKRNKKGTSVALKWKKVSGASGYEIQMSTKKASDFEKIANLNAKSKTYTKKSLNKSQTYYFRMRTYKTINGKKFYSGWSKVKKVSKVK